MKRKVVLGLIVFMMVCGAVGCGKKEGQTPVENPQVQVTPEETPAPKPVRIEGVEIVTGIEGHPSGIAVMDGDVLLVTDVYNKVIWEIKNGECTALAGESGPDDIYGEPLGGYSDTSLEKARFEKPWDIAPFLSGWAVSDSDNCVIRYFDGERVRTAAYKDHEKLLENPTGIAADEDGNLYIADASVGIIYRMNENGAIQAVADGFQDPTGLFWADGQLYVADTGNHRICAIKGSQVSVIAGGEEGFADGSTKEAAFRNPQGIAVSADGAVYVADTGNSAVRVIRDGQVKTLLSCGDESTWPVAPRAIAFYRGGLVVADEFSGVIFTMPCD